MCGNNTITYTEKTVNQFLNCSGINNEISDSDSVRETGYVYAYENGDTTKIVKFFCFQYIIRNKFSRRYNPNKWWWKHHCNKSGR